MHIDADTVSVLGPFLALIFSVWALWHLALWVAERAVHRAHLDSGVRAGDRWCRYCERESR